MLYKDIINTIVTDIIDNSYNKPYITMSEEVFTALKELKKFNAENIYSKSLTSEEIEYYRQGMNKIYTRYLNDLENNNKDSIIYKIFLNTQSEKYLKETSKKRQVIDFIAGMTDDMFHQEIEIQKKLEKITKICYNMATFEGSNGDYNERFFNEKKT